MNGTTLIVNYVKTPFPNIRIVWYTISGDHLHYVKHDFTVFGMGRTSGRYLSIGHTMALSLRLDSITWIKRNGIYTPREISATNVSIIIPFGVNSESASYVTKL